MLALNQSFDETRTIKVLVVPIGNNNLFDEHFQVVSNLRDVPFYELNRPAASSGTASSFKYFNWNDGNLLFEFQRYDRVLIGPGDLVNFQSSKRILMIMGLINYPELGETAEKIEEEMEYYARRHPNILLRRLFVFNYSFDHPQAHNMMAPLLSKIRDPSSLVIFPPEGQCGTTASGGVQQMDGSALQAQQLQQQQQAGMSMVDVHLTEVMSHAALRIVLALEQQMRHCEDARVRNTLPEGLPLSTIFDDLEDGSTNTTPRDGAQHPSSSSLSSKSNLSSKKPALPLYKKKPSGRIHKWMGDLAMQACSPRDALEHYAAAVAECRALNETLWLAGALEGYAAAVLLLLQRKGANMEELLGRELRSIVVPSAEGTAPAESVVDKCHRLVEERCGDAIAIYATSVVFCALEVEGLLRVARMLETCPSLYNREARVLDYVLRAVTVPGLNTQQQIEVTLEGGLRCHRLGLSRKYALFLYIAALMSADNENFGVANAECGIQAGVASDATPMQLASPSQRGTVQSSGGEAGGGSTTQTGGKTGATWGGAVWDSLRGALLATATLVADEHGDALAATHYLADLMKLIHDGEERHASQRVHWEQYLPRRLFVEDRQGVLGAAAGSRVGAAAVRSNSVRWEAEGGRQLSSLQVTVDPGAAPAVAAPQDRSPVLRRAKSSEEGPGIISAASSHSDVPESRTPPPLHRSPSPMPPRKPGTVTEAASTNTNSTSSATTGISYPPDSERDRDFARYRAMTASVSNATDLGDVADMRAAHSSANLSAPSTNGRRVAVPGLPERLNALSQISRPSTGSTKSLQASGDFSAAVGGVRAGGQGEFLMERLLRAFSQQADGTFTFTTSTPVHGAPGSLPSTSRDDSSGGALAVDALEVVAGLLTTSRFPSELQEETYGLFARLSRAIPPCSRVAVPLALHTLRPTELTGCARPVPVTAGALVTAKRNFTLLKQRLQDNQPGSGASTPKDGPSAGTTSTSLFYDPFAAKRQRQKVQAQQNDVLWAVGQRCTFVAVLSNPLRVPIFLTAVFPVLKGCECTVHPVAVHVPPCVDRYEVELSVTPSATGQLEVVGLQFIVNNATHVLAVDKTGRSEGAPSEKLSSKQVQGQRRSVATNSVTVTPASPSFEIRTSWNDAVSSVGFNTGAIQGGADLDRALTISAGEVREERVWLHAAHAGSLGEDGSSTVGPGSTERETHIQITLRVHSHNGKSSAAVLRPYTGALGSGAPAAVELSSALALSSCVHNPAPVLAPFATDYVPASTLESVLADLAVVVRQDTSVEALDLEVEVCRASAAVLQAIAGLQQDGADEPALTGPAGTSLTSTLKAEDLNLYARCHRLRVHLRHAPCVSVRTLELVDSCTALEVPPFEVAAAAEALQRLLGHCAAQRQLSKPGGSSEVHALPRLKLIPSTVQVLFQAGNKSDWPVDLCSQKGTGTDTSTGVDAPVVDLQLPAHSVRSLVLQYPSDAAAPSARFGAGEHSPRLLTWRCHDQTRTSVTFQGQSQEAVAGPCSLRSGSVLYQGQCVDLGRRSSQIVSILDGIPAWAVSCGLFSRTTSGELERLAPRLCDARLGDLFAVAPGRFYDLTISINLGSEDRLSRVWSECELALVVVRNEVPVLPAPADQRERGLLDGSHSSGVTLLEETVKPAHVLTGKPYARYVLKATGDGAATVQHQVRLCLPQPCSVTVYPLLRPVAAEAGMEGDWWCGERSYIRLVAAAGDSAQ